MEGVTVHDQVCAFDKHFNEGMQITGMKPDKGLRKARFYNMVQMLRLVLPKRMSIAEVGVYKGLSSYLICNAVKDYFGEYDGNAMYLFDSFEGLSEPRDIDELPKTFKGKFSDTSVEHVKKVLRDFPKVEVNRGWIPKVFEETYPYTSYAFVHIDVDLYAPTLDALIYFYDRLVPGGIIVIDDVGFPGPHTFKGCAKALTQFCAERGITCSILTTNNGVIQKEGK